LLALAIYSALHHRTGRGAGRGEKALVYAASEAAGNPAANRRYLRLRRNPLSLPIMQIAQDAVVLIHYTLTDDAGNKLDASDGTPLAYLHGNGNLIPGLERELEGKSAGAKLSVKIAAADAYGEYDKTLLQRVPRRALKGVGNLQVGMQLHTQSAHGVRAVTVTQIQGDMVTIDGNHPLAGQSLNFDVEIAEVRAATEEELAHGHVHGPGGHHDH
jgi:FKBP-type peptidyl-prolyl cis-trans isomerase SlyD